MKEDYFCCQTGKTSQELFSINTNTNSDTNSKSKSKSSSSNTQEHTRTSNKTGTERKKAERIPQAVAPQHGPSSCKHQI